MLFEAIASLSALGKSFAADTSGEAHRVHRALHGISVHLMFITFIMSIFDGALDNLQAFGRVKTCLASSGCVMAREVLGPMNILNMRGFLGKVTNFIRSRVLNWTCLFLLVFPDSGRDSLPSSSNALDSKSP